MGISTAEEVASLMGDDGSSGVAPDGRTLAQVVAAYGGDPNRRSLGVVRYDFADRSAIVVCGAGWDLAFDSCDCWVGAGHTDDCPDGANEARREVSQ